MSLLKYKLLIAVPIPSPSGEFPSSTEIIASNESTGESVELSPSDGQLLRAFLEQAWYRGRQLE